MLKLYLKCRGVTLNLNDKWEMNKFIDYFVVFELLTNWKVYNF